MVNNAELDLKDYEVFDHALRGDGKPVGLSILSRVLFDPDVNGSIFFGQGASGKSMLLGQTVRLLKQKSQMDILRAQAQGQDEVQATKSNWVLPQIFPFDQAVIRVKLRLGGGHQTGWEPSVWDQVSKEIFDDMNPALDQLQTRPKVIRGKEPLWHIFNDSVVVGDLNKGTTAVRDLVRRRDVMAYGVISDPMNQERAIKLREESEKDVSPEAIESMFISEGVMVDIDDFGRVPLLMKGMANRRLIEENNQQIEAKTDWVIANNFADFKDYPLPDSVKTKIEANYSADRIKDIMKYYQRRLIHMTYLLRVQLGATQKNSTPLFNIHLQGSQIHWYQRDIEGGIG